MVLAMLRDMGLGSAGSMVVNVLLRRSSTTITATTAENTVGTSSQVRTALRAGETTSAGERIAIQLMTAAIVVAMIEETI